MPPPSALQAVKLWLVNHVGLAKDALHIYVALGLFLAVCLAFRWPVQSWRPWLVVLAVALAGEAGDLRDSMAHRAPINLSANWHDLWNTMFWPSAIVLLARLTRLFER
ncbi:MAG: hypothetical protein C0476_07230 [Sphingomonas sp.]|nr:hypothetical protein [Sphingomonas sp.]